MLLLVVHIDKVQLAGPLGQALAPAFSSRRITGAPKGLKRNARHGPAGSGNSTASPQIIFIGARARPAARQTVRFLRAIRASVGLSSTPTTSRNGNSRRQQHRPPHPRAHIDKAEFLNRPARPAPPPTAQQRLEDRRRNAIVSRRMAVMRVPALQVPSGNQPAGPHAELFVEGWRVNPSPTLSPGSSRLAAFCRLSLRGISILVAPSTHKSLPRGEALEI